MSEVRGDVDQIVDASFNAFLEEQAQEYGPDDLGADVLAEVDGAAEASGTEEARASEAPGSRRQGTDVVLARLRDSDPEAAVLVSEMQRRMSRDINEVSDLREMVLDLRERLVQMSEDPREAAASEEAPALPDGITEDHVKVFKQVADHLGYVPRAELAQREVSQSSDSYVQQALTRGVEQYGEDFGTVDETGAVHLSPAVSARLKQRMESLQDPRKGITPLDLFILEFGPEAGKRAVAKAAAPARRPAAVARRSSGGQSRPRIYDPSRKDDPGDVIDRAWALARRSMVNL